MTTRTATPIRATTWLAPGLPTELFAIISRHLATHAHRRTELSIESKISGPMDPSADRFDQGRTDVGFLCPPSYLWLTDREPASVQLVPLAPVYDDPRGCGMPVYFSDVVVAADSNATTFDDLEGADVGFNDLSSLSGFVSMKSRLAQSGRTTDWFGNFRHVGSHREALHLISNGELDAAAVDTNVWQAWQSESPDRVAAVRSVEALGPFPVQPIVVRTAVVDDLLPAVVAALSSPELAADLRPFGVAGFGPIDHAVYEAIRPQVSAATGGLVAVS